MTLRDVSMIEAVIPAPAGIGWRIEDVRGIAAAAALGQEWRALLDLDPAATVFQRPEWVLSWWEHLADQEEPALCGVRDGEGRLIALVPVTRSRTGGIRRLNVLGRGGSLTECVDLVAIPDTAPAAAAVLWRHWQRAGDWDLLAAPNVPALRPFGRMLLAAAQRAGRRAVVERQAQVQRPLPTTWAEFTASLGRNQRKHLKKFGNRLTREGAAVRFVVAEDPRGLDAALDRFFRLHRARAASGLPTPHKDRFNTPARRRFLTAAARQFADDGRLLPCFLEVEGTLVAAQLCFRHGQTFSPYHSGYDPAWAWHGVMLTLFARCVALAIDLGCTVLDLGLGLNQEKERWGGQPSPTISLVIGAAGPRGEAAAGLYRVVRSVRDARERLRPAIRNGTPDDDGSA